MPWPLSILRGMKTIAVVDGQGGGIGSYIIRALKENFGESVEVVALGTNSNATAAMLKARANKGATGENAIIWNAPRVDIITGSLSIVLANSMLGELTPAMAAAIASSRAIKVLLPINQEHVDIINVQREPLPHLIEKLVERIKEEIYV
jgi:Ni,Fe-hydrogenase maturation factor